MKTFLVISIFWALASGKPSERIVGGEPTTIEEIPYQAVLIYYDRQHCGGSVLSADWVITAAHCVHRKNVTALNVRVGSTLWSEGGSLHTIARRVIHPMWDTGIYLDYDYALLQVDPPISLSTDLPTPIPLALLTPPAGTLAQVSGWGDGNTPSTILHRVEIPIVSTEVCKEAYVPSSITPRMLCAGPLEGGRGSCYGDSGGPLVVGGQLVGLVSWAFRCAQPEYPTVYADVAEESEWIRNITGI